MNVKLISYPTDEDWAKVKMLALATAGRKPATALPTDAWKLQILKSEHSPIRSLMFTWAWEELPYWVSVHFVRHKIGIEHFVQSQRNDRQNKYDRNSAPQNALVTHTCIANAQAIINISKLRLCNKAATETKYAWMMLLRELKRVAPNVEKFCVPNCVYRGGICPEFESCGYNKSKLFDIVSEEYLSMPIK